MRLTPPRFVRKRDYPAPQYEPTEPKIRLSQPVLSGLPTALTAATQLAFGMRPPH
ncbi:hypothetical protein DR96_4017 (plasmid) [Providencia stuartii]|nr:hypothetical protein DR96_4017 [Providencia stuartii]